MRNRNRQLKRNKGRCRGSNLSEWRTSLPYMLPADPRAGLAHALSLAD